MVSKHAIERGIQRIDNNSLKKNKKSNITKIMRKDAYSRYFAFSICKATLIRYVERNGIIFKYILDKFTIKIITVHQVDFNNELLKGYDIKYVR